MARRRGEEVERVDRPVDEVRRLLERDAWAASLLLVGRRCKRVAERQGVDLLVLVRERFGTALTLHVVCEADAAALRKALGQPVVHALGSLDRARRDHDAG